jgi:hypothetical protein
MSLTPIKSETLRALQAEREIARRQHQHNLLITDIYYKILQNAEIGRSCYYHPIPQIKLHGYSDLYVIDTILQRLNELFPDASVVFKNLRMGNDGKLYDPADMTVAFIAAEEPRPYIVIDWSVSI